MNHDLDNNEWIWIQEAQQGDLLAFEKLMRQYEQKIYNICLRLIKEPHEASDAAQEVCIKIWKHLAHFKGEAKFSTWVYRIATNTCLDRLRQSKKRLEVEIVGEEMEHATSEEGRAMPWRDLSCYVEEKERNAIIRQGIEELPEDYRVIIVLRDLDGYSYEQIAEALELSMGTVKSRLSRARLKLKQILEQNKEPYCALFSHTI